jgi:hypothetical protein
MKPGRKSETTMKPEFGKSRKAIIAGQFAGGANNVAVWRAMEAHYPQTVADDAARKALCEELGVALMPFDAAERDSLGKAIRQVKGLMIKEDKALEDELEVAHAGNAKSASEIEYRNRSRFLSSIPALDTLYGKTYFQWLSDAPNSKYEEQEFTVRRTGEKKKRLTWVSGDYRQGALMPAGSMGDQSWKPKNGIWTVEDEKLAYIEEGFPEAFLSLWGGAPGVGKTRLAISVTKALNAMGESVLYYNGEADEQDFRGWLGGNVDEDLLKIVSGEMIRTETAIEQIYTYKPRVVFFDSWQMLAEYKKGNNARERLLSQFKLLKADEDAGRPHLILISQLNKADELAGGRNIEHMVDMAAIITKIEGRKKQFLFEVPGKNRAGETGIGRPFEHGPFGVRCIASDARLRTEPLYKSLSQAVSDSSGITGP